MPDRSSQPELGTLAFHVPEFRIKPLAHPELRKDPIIDRWVIISTDRLGRPVEFLEEPTRQPLANCPFCAGHEDRTPPPTFVFPSAQSWQVRVVPNTFPAVRSVGSHEGTISGWFQVRAARGIHEVIVICPQHESNFARLAGEQWASVFAAFQDRLRFLATWETTLFPVVFANQGLAAGASLEHAHAQLIALPDWPELLTREWNAGCHYYQATHRCIYCDWLTAELEDRSRVVIETKRFVVVSAYAARCPAECWLLPKEHQSHLEPMDESSIREFAEVFSQILRKLDRGLRSPPLNFYVHTAPPRQPSTLAMHWHIEVLPRLTGIAGFEWGSGMNINPVPPEQAAAYLRDIAVE